MFAESLASILQWLRVRSRLFGWDAIVALDRFKINRLLKREYIRRFNTGSYLPPVSGEVSGSNEARIVIHDFRLAHPRLSFENADLNDSKARLRMAVVGGNQLALRKNVSDWYVQRLDWIGPLAGPELHLDVHLDDAPGQVAGDGRILLDLSKSDNFSLTFSNDAQERELGGNFFKELFNRLPDAQRVWSLGEIDPGSRPLLRPRSFRLRTQAKPPSKLAPASAEAQEAEGAVLAFINMKSGHDGSLPDASSDFRYLIPDDAGQETSATVLFNARRLIIQQLIERFSGFIKDASFVIEYDQQGGVMGAYCDVGRIELPAMGGWNSSDFEYRGRQFHIDMLTVVEATVIQAGNKQLRIDFSGDTGVRVSWVATSDMEIRLVLLSFDTKQYRQEDLDRLFPAHRSVTVQCFIDYELVDREGGVLEMTRLEIDGLEHEIKPPVLAEAQLEHARALYESGDRMPAPIPTNEDGLNPIEAMFVLLYMVGQMIVLPAQQAMRTAAVEPLRERLGRDLPVAEVLEPLVKETLRLSFGNLVVSDQVRGPKDVVMFGKVNPDGGSFEVTALEPVLEPGGTLQFKVEPPRKVYWKVEALTADADDPGEIDTLTGWYTAPGVSHITAGFTQARVTALDPDSGFTAAALVTVVDHAIALSPMLEVVEPGGEVALMAGTRETADIQWSFVNAAPHGALREPGGTGRLNTYLAGADSRTEAYKLDLVKVRNNASGDERVTCLVTRMRKKKPMPVTPEEWGSSAQQDWVRLALWVGSEVQTDVQWTVLYGPGEIKGDRYEVGRNRRDRFVVIGGHVESPDWGALEGFIILPLPLDGAVEAYEAQSSQGRRLRLARRTATGASSAAASQL
ncbi:hypothetical protein [Pseudomonas putida]|uniref:hypothetical protein n=1 Tax=Pseudomonas putida TaxID=303 RepID=UPI0018D5D13A|nr:hypothetical protein [Pseudomonas putida]MBH3411724.1 hypothetical protein [Pseudomonas putida]